MIARLRYFAVWLVTLAGCHDLFNVEEIDGSDTDATTPGDADIPGSCDAPLLLEIFDTADQDMPCGVGFSFSNLSDGGVSIAGAALSLNLGGANHPGAVGCSFYPAAPLSTGGVFVHVLDPLRTSASYTFFKVRHPDTSMEPEISIGFAGSTLTFEVNRVAIATLNELPAWWRIRRGATSTVLAEVSDDGSAWRAWSASTVELPAQIGFDIGAGITAQSEPGSARIAAIGMCR